VQRDKARAALRRAEAAVKAEQLEHYYVSVGLADAYITRGDIAGAIHLLTNGPPELRPWGLGRCVYQCFQDLLTSWLDLHADPRQGAAHAKVTWKVPNPAHPDLPRCLYHRIWDTPRPEVEVRFMDSVSRGTHPGPFLFAVTMEL
jgi:hypothetical protein